MINIKKYNYFLFDDPKSPNLLISISGLKRIVDFLEIENRNQLLIVSENSPMKYLIDNKIEISLDIDKLTEIIKDKSKLFRVDLLIIDLMNVEFKDMKKYFHILSKSIIDFIIIVPKYYENDILINDNTNIYEISKKYVRQSFDQRESKYQGGSPRKWGSDDSKYFITDKINNFITDFDSLKKSYIRDKKINIIFGKK